MKSDIEIAREISLRKIKEIADYVCDNKAGEGALREFSEWLVEKVLV